MCNYWGVGLFSLESCLVPPGTFRGVMLGFAWALVFVVLLGAFALAVSCSQFLFLAGLVLGLFSLV